MMRLERGHLPDVSRHQVLPPPPPLPTIEGNGEVVVPMHGPASFFRENEDSPVANANCPQKVPLVEGAVETAGDPALADHEAEGANCSDARRDDEGEGGQEGVEEEDADEEAIPIPTDHFPVRTPAFRVFCVSGSQRTIRSMTRTMEKICTTSLVITALRNSTTGHAMKV
jgi:hypothetical protein